MPYSKLIGVAVLLNAFGAVFGGWGWVAAGNAVGVGVGLSMLAGIFWACRGPRRRVRRLPPAPLALRPRTPPPPIRGFHAYSDN